MCPLARAFSLLRYSMTSVSSSAPIRIPARPPRFPHVWLWLLVVSQLTVVAVWWMFGWRAGLPAMMASHVPFWWGTLWPRSQVLMPALTRLPTREKAVWLTIDDGPSDETLPMLDLLDARGVISVTERQSYIMRVRELATACGEAWVHTEAGRAA